MFKSFNLNIKPHNFFLIIGFVFGLSFILLTPPFQGPDEINHFYRAYQISEGNFVSLKKDQRLGGEIPKSLTELTQCFIRFRGNSNTKISFRSFKNQFNIKLNPTERVYADFPNTAMYAPLVYLPQALAIFIFRQFEFAPLKLLYIARFSSFLVWLFFVFVAIRLIPFYKWLTVCLGLLPMSVFINVTLSADVLTNATSFLMIAFVLYLANTNKTITLSQMIILILISITLSLSKLVYTPLILLYFLIPIKHFKNFKTYWITIGSIFIFCFVLNIVWLSFIQNLYVPFDAYNINYRNSYYLSYGCDMNLQKELLLKHPGHFIDILLNSFTHSFKQLYKGYIGSFGWLDSFLPFWLINLSYFTIVFLCLFENSKQILFSWKNKLLLLFVFLITLLLILLSQYLTWDYVGSPIISSLQGRYIIPIMPILFFCLYNNSFNFSKIKYVVLSFSLISLGVSANVLYTRYYMIPSKNFERITCDAENIKNYYFVSNQNEIVLENVQTRSDEKARSGKYAVKLSKKDNFGFTLRLYDCDSNDIMHLEVWRFGKTGGIQISGEQNSFAIANDKVSERDSLGWEKIELNYTIPKNMNGIEVGIFAYNYQADSTYFDDIKVTRERKK